MKAAIIMDDPEARRSFHQYLAEDRTAFKKIYAFNSIDTFISDAYMLTDVSVILLDMHLSAGICSIEGFDIINRTPFLEKAEVLMLTSVSDNNYTIFKWLCSYGSSYIDREMPFHNIKQAMITLNEKGKQMAPIATKRNSIIRKARGPVRNTEIPLTLREKQVVQQLVEHKNEKETGEALKIRAGLVRKYIRTAYKKVLINANINLSIPIAGPMEINYKRVG